MKKLMILTAILSAVSFTTFAQNNDYAHNPNLNESRPNYRGDRDFDKDRSWGYDSNWNRTRSNGNMKINSFQRQARERIANGIVEGTVNSNEAKRLLEFAERIETKENRYMRNGRISNSEARELQEDLSRLNRMISRETRDFDRQNNDDFGRNRRY